MFEIKKEGKKELFGRREIEASFLGSNLSFDNAKNFLAEKFKTAEESIAVKSIDRKFGSPEMSILAYIYESPEMLVKFEPKFKEPGLKVPSEKKKEKKK